MEGCHWTKLIDLHCLEPNLDGGNRVLVVTSFGASKTLFVEAFRSLKNGLD